MEKRNIIEDGRTPSMGKHAALDQLEKDAVAAFAACEPSADEHKSDAEQEPEVTDG